MVPYERNPKLTGRKQFIQVIKEKLDDHVPNQFNHRIALYGMGGVGKTQCALEYVHSNQTNYERTYWITGTDQASILSGYQKIAKRANLLGLQSASPLEIAEAVLSWLRRDSRTKLAYRD